MKVGIMGLGYVGLPLAVAFADQGHNVAGVDIDGRKIEGLMRGESYVEDIPSTRVRAVRDRMEVTTRAANLSRCDTVLVCVPTPPTESRTSVRCSRRPVCSPTSRRPGSWSYSSRRPTRAPRASGWRRPSRSPATSRGATSTWPSRRNGSIRAAPTTRCATRPRSSAG